MDGIALQNSPPPLTMDQIDAAFAKFNAPSHRLRDEIGQSKGRISCEEYLNRLDWVIKTIPQWIYPSSAALSAKYEGQTAIIVGGGPSLLDTYDELRAQCIDRDKVKIFAPNKSHDFLINGKRKTKKTWERIPLVPDFGVLCDPSDFVVTYQTPHPKVQYLLASWCDKRVFARFLKAQAKAFIWVPVYENDGSDIEEIKRRQYPVPIHFVSGGSTVGLRTINLALAFGFDEVDLYGFDACYAPLTEKTLYAYDKPVIVHKMVDTAIRSRLDGTFFRYRTNEQMAKQAMEFDDMLDRLPEMRADNVRKQMTIRVHGDGLIPWLAWKASGPNTLIQHANPEKMYEKYGPKSWDYVENRPMTDDEIAFWQAKHERRVA